jgi:amino acid adenylation domain-containing protein
MVLELQSGSAAGQRAFPPPGSIALPAVCPADAAYIFFTSGSTGKPKGVLGSHKGLSHFLGWQRSAFGIGPGDRVAQLTALSFDAVLRDTFLPLTSGATLCLRDRDQTVARSEVITWLQREEITVVHAVPSVAEAWLAEHDTTDAIRSMRRSFFMGEPLTEVLIRRWRSAFPLGEIVNFYGPTETTLIKCFYRVGGEPHPGVQPIGRPIPDTQALVVTPGRLLCGLYEPGEIALRTPFRSLGYINAPEENRRRFVPNPFRDDPDDLIYLTGDSGYYRSDGSIQILGRLDDEIKIRGVRIDPAEITATLGQHPLVRACAVLGKKKVNGENYLVAYVVPGEEKPDTGQLRSYLLEQLPPAMIPGFFVFVDVLPLTPNGKVDRSALSEPDWEASAPKTYMPPRTETEKIIAGIWSAVLKVPTVSAGDNFFDLGGHSLLATQIVSRLRDAFHVEVALRALFEMPTVAGLSRHVDRTLGAGQRDPLAAAGEAETMEEVIL